MRRAGRKSRHRGGQPKAATRRAPVAIAVAPLILVLGGLVFWWGPPRSARPRVKLSPPVELVPIKLGTPDVPKPPATTNYAGTESCRECHADQYRTYRRTAHSLALADVDTAREPPNATFFHEASGRSYTVYRQDGQLHHREAVLDDDGSEIASSDYPVRYVIGSGRHARSYIVDIDGFHCESPLTWYALEERWGMSPSYDVADHRGFERPVDSECLNCHVGRLGDKRAFQRVEIIEQAIGCERCHGPGKSHVAEQRAIRDGHRAPKTAAAAIVNPARLARSLSEAICAQCHLSTGAIAIARGRKMSDFRPGMPLTDICTSYCRKEANSQMTVAGHVEQLRLSKCYLSSQTLSCTTCHDPHADLEPAEKRSSAMRTCIECHTEQGCSLAIAERSRQPSGNDCISCHMPQADTEVPHVAFTHHRIGIHSATTGEGPAGNASEGIAELVPLDEPEGLSQLDRERNLGLAYYSLTLNQTDPNQAAAYFNRARVLLESVRRQGGGHGEVAAALVHIYRYINAEAALDVAQEALASGGLAAKSETNCLYFIGEWGVQRGQPATARQALERLTTKRLLSLDWLLLGVCRERLGDLSGACSSLERACRLAPLRPEMHYALADAYQHLGKTHLAQREQDVAARLKQRVRPLGGAK